MRYQDIKQASSQGLAFYVILAQKTYQHTAGNVIIDHVYDGIKSAIGGA